MTTPPTVEHEEALPPSPEAPADLHEEGKGSQPPRGRSHRMIMRLSWGGMSAALVATALLLTTELAYTLTMGAPARAALWSGALLVLPALLLSLVFATLSGAILSAYPKLREMSALRLSIGALFGLSFFTLITLAGRAGALYGIRHFRRDHYKALAAGLSGAGAALLALILAPLFWRLGASLLRWCQSRGEEAPTPPNPVRAESAVLLFALLGIIALWALPIALPSLHTVERRPLWAGLIWGASLAGILATPRKKYAPLRLGSASLCTLCLFALAFAPRMMSAPEALSVHRDSLLSRWVFPSIEKLFDEDRDGVPGAFGGRDCDDRDPKKRPGAYEPVGRDLNCDGWKRRRIERPFKGPSARERRTIGLPAPTPVTHTAEPKTVAPARGIEAASAKAGDAPSEESTSLESLIEGTAQAEAPKHLLILTIDALRADFARQYMPKLMSWAKDAADFRSAYSTSAATYWSIPSLMVSKMPSAIEMGRDQTPVGRERLLFESLSQRGFATSLFANVTIFFVRGLRQGAKHLDYETSKHTVHGAHPGSDFLTDRLLKRLDRWSTKNGAARGVRGKQRFAMWAHYYDPHDPYFEVPGFPAASSSDRDRYIAILQSLDQALARLFEGLEARGLAASTAVLLTADHGDEFREHAHRFHGRSLYDEMVHVPLILKLPGQPGRVIEAPISHRDLAPTLVELLGLPAERTFSGKSWASAISGEVMPDHPVFFELIPDSNYQHPQVGIRWGRWKLIRHLNRGGEELYDLEADPAERENLLGTPLSAERRGVYRTLQRRLSAYSSLHLSRLAEGKSGGRRPPGSPQKRRR
ncbi:MAG: sulfatase-like hydrolase/transferase [Myxococcota bacterium]|nr:sulfatase-like hydrolase/transferase [Myxococcota bacterium]